MYVIKTGLVFKVIAMRSRHYVNAQETFDSTCDSFRNELTQSEPDSNTSQTSDIGEHSLATWIAYSKTFPIE